MTCALACKLVAAALQSDRSISSIPVYVSRAFKIPLVRMTHVKLPC